LFWHDGQAPIAANRTCNSTEEVVTYFESLPAIDGIGVDTLTCWSTGGGGWRPADRWLRGT